MTVLGIDIGTSACKALLLSETGEILGRRTVAYGMAQPRPGWTEQDPASWIEGARRAVAGLLAEAEPSAIRMIGLSGQMHGLTPLDADGAVIRPAILWNDQRNGAEADEIIERAGGAEALLGMTNNRMLIGYTGGKILWMQRAEPAAFDRLRHALNPKDYLRLVLTGEFATEVSDASGTGLFDVRARCWCRPLLERLPFDADILPDCFESAAVSGAVSRHGAALFGLAAGTPVIGGGGDAVIQTLGSGVVAPGVLQTTIGTGGILAAALREPVENPDGRLQVFCNVAADLWHCMGVSLNAGGALAWLRAALFRDLAEAPDYEGLVSGASQIAPGCEGVMFLPYIYGERCPHPDPDLRGALIGLSVRHDVRHMTRALMEGVVYSLYDIYRLMEPLGIASDLIRASGGGARSQLWRQMQADLFGCPVTTTQGAAEGGAFGAALLAGVAAGAWANVAEAAACCHDLTRQQPEPGDGALYRRGYRVFAGLHDMLRQTSAELSALRRPS